MSVLRPARWLRVCLLAGAVLLASCADEAEGDLRAAVVAADPGSTLRVPAGEHPGPVFIDKPLTLVGTEGAWVIAEAGGFGIVVDNTEDVQVRDLGVRGGETGILVRSSQRVRLSDVTVEDTHRWGILVRDAHAEIRRCTVRGLTSDYGRGIEVINAELRRLSVVDRCQVEGPVFEGIASRLSQVRFVDNQVAGSTERGVVITEMSMGRMERNTVTDARGSAYFCGDMSYCEVVGNRALRIGPSEPWQSSQGHGLVVHYHSDAFLRDHSVDGLTGEPVVLALGSSLAPRPLAGGVEVPGVAGIAATVLVLLLFPPLAARLRGRPRLWAPLMFTTAILVQVFHQAEHVAQVFQAKLFNRQQAHGLAGAALDNEWVHLGYNTVLTLALLAILVGYGRAGLAAWGRRAPLALGVLLTGVGIQLIHQTDHLVKVYQYVTTGAEPAPGFLGDRLDLIWLHFGINLAVTVALVVAYVALRVHQDLATGAPARLYPATG